MGSLEETCASLRAQIAAAETHLAGLKRDLANAEQAAHSQNATTAEPEYESRNGEGRQWPLLQEEYKRYGRQMIVSQVGLKGKRRLPFDAIP
jgi:adenylyltransferase/sulfurtransferase